MFVEEVFGHLTEQERIDLITLLGKVHDGPLSTMLQKQMANQADGKYDL